ncbi:pirin family protein [Burkholderia pseudomultivorans]|uniref:pirin family protein n=1 Tax=Burkholderia pseudomultivorans TaxID=1207504 RepID=UPI00188F945C|nr:pirin family protein [Burkholderia pseudomultivorans]MBF5011061.1 pirin family protein [Burkholderia pseudomultivorans]
MFQIRRAVDRDQRSQGWHESRHSLPCAAGGAPSAFGALRELTEECLAPTRGFGMQPYRDVEIVTFVLDGALAYRDSLGSGAIVRAGGLQRTSAGTGIMLSETNASRDRPLRLLRFRLAPAGPGGRPGYVERRFADDERRGRLRVVASPDGGDGSLRVHADASIFAALVDGDERAVYAVPAGRRVYAHVVSGDVEINGHALAAGDGARIGGVHAVALSNGRAADVLLLDVA